MRVRNFQLGILLGMFGVFVGSAGLGQSQKSGALILVSVEGEVEFFDALGEPSEQKIEVGGIIPMDFSIATGSGSSAICLFSNGTLMTLTEKTRMKVGEFKQEPFEPGGRELKDLVEEPSSSEVVVDLDFGSLVVKTKKLNKSSSFDINSPLGTAGIRGTEFQMALDPGQGVQLDVTESTVAFSPPGGGQPVAVSQGSGLSVSPTGAVTQRPVNPVVAQQISTTNQAATEVSAEVSMDTMSAAMEQATVDASAEEGGDRMEESSEEPAEKEESAPAEEEPAPVEEEATMEEGTAEEPSEDAGAESEPASESEPGAESEPGGAEEPATETDGSAGGESADAGSSEGTSMESSDSGAVESTSSEGAPSESAPVESASVDSPSGESAGAGAVEPSSAAVAGEGAGAGVPASEPVAAATPVDAGAAQASVLENNSELTVARKTGKFDEFTRELAKFGLSDEQTMRFYEFSEGAKIMVLGENEEVVNRLLRMEGFGGEQADLFYSYSKRVREKILGLEDVAMVPLINQRIDEFLLDEALTTLNLGLSNSRNLPESIPVVDSLETRRHALNELLIKHGNEKLIEELTELSQGELSEEWLEVGEFAAELLQDRMIGDSSTLPVFQAGKVVNSPFYAEVASLYQELELEMLVAGESDFLAGRNLIVGNNARALSPYFGEGVKTLNLSASQNLEFSADLEWEGQAESNARLVVMSAGALKFAPEMTLRSATSDLVLSTRQDLVIDRINFEVARELAVRGMRDVSISSVSMGADALAKIKARRNLNVDGLNFSRDVSRVVMEATTIRLSNVNFPAASAVQLNSLKGPIDGKYPNFGTSIPAVQQMGRVNFIENVSSGGNRIMNRPSFDQFGGNISIGKVANP